MSFSSTREGLREAFVDTGLLAGLPIRDEVDGDVFAGGEISGRSDGGGEVVGIQVAVGGQADERSAMWGWPLEFSGNKSIRKSPSEGRDLADADTIVVVVGVPLGFVGQFKSDREGGAGSNGRGVD